jgi:biotin synthase-like enzyme
MDVPKLVKEAEKVYLDNFSNETSFDRCIFVSWYCSLGNCTFCYRSTQKSKIRNPRMSKRTMSSILTEAILCKNLGWNLDFITGGFGVYTIDELVEIAKNVSIVVRDKVWLNYGIFGNVALEKFRPYVKGICSSIETVNSKVQKEVVPGKKIEDYIGMLKNLEDFKKSLAIVIGIGETEKDIEKLHSLINETNLDRLTIFALHPIKGTPFTEGPKVDYYVRWIAETRIKFPKLEIVAGIPSDGLEHAGLALKAGANAITKFPAIKLFGTSKAHVMEEQIKFSGRKFNGSLTRLPLVDWDTEVDRLKLDSELKKEIKVKLSQYLGKMEKNCLV